MTARRAFNKRNRPGRARETNDFHAYQDRAGGTADFHALRHPVITNLVNAGVLPKDAKELARYSTTTRPMDPNAHVGLVRPPTEPGAATGDAGCGSVPTGEGERGQKLLWADRTITPVPGVTSTISPAEVDAARRQARALPWPGEAKEALEEVLKELAREGVRPGDRRQAKTVGAVRAFAYLSGADEVLPDHLEVARHTLWDDPHEQPVTCERVIARVARPPGMRVTELLLEAEQVLAAADVKNLSSAAAAAAKLGEIDKQLAAVTAHPRADTARSYLKDELRKLKRASLEAV